MTEKGLYLSWSHATGTGVSKEDGLSWSALGKAQLSVLVLSCPVTQAHAFLHHFI